MLAVTVATYTGPALVLVKLPLSVCAESPGAMLETVLVCTAVMAVAPERVEAVPVPEPPVVQYAIATPPPTRATHVASVTATFVFLLNLIIVCPNSRGSTHGFRPFCAQREVIRALECFYRFRTNLRGEGS